MAERTVLSELSVNTEANAFAALMDGGFVDFYDGVPPKDADTPVKGQTLGVTLGFGSPAFGPAVAGVIVANPVAPGVAGQGKQRATAQGFIQVSAAARSEQSGQFSAGVCLVSLDALAASGQRLQVADATSWHRLRAIGRAAQSGGAAKALCDVIAGERPPTSEFRAVVAPYYDGDPMELDEYVEMAA